MGIPFYFYTLAKKYDNIIVPKIDFQPDIYCLDFNGVIHPVCASILQQKPKATNTEIINGLYNKVQDDITTIKPQKTIICVDGSVPLAKMIQQRKRRYLSVYRNKIDKFDVNWDTNCITPGTDFMNELNIVFRTKLRYSTENISFSGSDEYGEGEQKIFKHLKTEKSNSSIVINGMDADLIILSLMSNRQNIHLMRETDTRTYINIDNLRKAIINEMVLKWSLDSQMFNDIYSKNSIDLVESYCVMCSLLGNDFIPHLLTLKLKSNGLDKLIQYTGNSYETYGLLVQDDKINYETLTDIIQQIAKSEDTDIVEECKKYVSYRLTNTNNMKSSDYYAMKNKDNLASIIYTDQSKWKQNYYKYIFGTCIQKDSSVVSSACLNYITGIYWTYAYYKCKDYDDTWYYPYTYPPVIKDISNHLVGNTEPIIENHRINIDSNIQLLIVLPYESRQLVDIKYRKYFENVKYGMRHLYPTEYKIQTFLKTHLWECEPVLPTININYIRTCLE
jgi:5'-3' exonuclease